MKLISSFKSLSIALAALTAACVFLTNKTYAQDSADGYPSKPVSIIVAKNTGGVDDTVGRLLATHLVPLLGQPAVVINKPGAGGVTGTVELVNSKPDGYTLQVINLASQIATAAVRDPQPYDALQDFTPVALIASYNMVLVVSNRVPSGSLDEFADHARENPGTLSYVTSGRGALNHLASMLVMREKDFDMVDIPYSSGGEAALALNAGDVQFHFTDVNTAQREVDMGNAVALGQSGTERSAVLPDVPLLSELGVASLSAPRWIALIAPPGTPIEILQELNEKVNDALETPELLEAANKMGIRIPSDRPTSEELRRVIEKDVETWVPIAKEVMSN